jgi:HEAT repeat protein
LIRPRRSGKIAGFVRYSAAVALRQLAGPANRELLLTTYARATSRQKFGLALALAKLKEPIALEALAGAVGSQDPDLRRRAAEAFGDYASTDVTNALVRLCKDSNAAVQDQAAVSLRKVLNCVGATTTNERPRSSSDWLPGD